MFTAHREARNACWYFKMEIFESAIDEIALSGLEGGISSDKCFL